MTYDISTMFLLVSALGAVSGFGHDGTQSANVLKCDLALYPSAPSQRVGDTTYIWGLRAATGDEVIEKLMNGLSKAGMKLSDVAFLNVVVAAAELEPTAYEAISKVFPADAMPAVTVVSAGLCDGANVQVDAIAVAGEKIYSSKGVRVGDVGYIGGVAEVDYETQLNSIEASLGELGFTVDDWVVHNLGMLDSKDADAMNAQVIEFNLVQNKWVGDRAAHFSAQSAMPVPGGKYVSSIVAHTNVGGVLNSAPTTPSNGFLAPYSPMPRGGDAFSLSGAASYTGESMGNQTKAIVDQLKGVLAQKGASTKDVFAVRFYVSNEASQPMAQSIADMMTEFSKQMGDSPRVVSVVVPPRLGGGPSVEIEMYARVA